MFRYYADLALALVTDGAAQPADLVARNESGDLSQLTPTQFLADHVIAFYREDQPRPRGLPHFVIIIEVQLEVDERKDRSWPAYVANAAVRYDCEAMLLVVTDRSATAAWAKGPFGPSQLQLRPAVWCLKEVPQRLMKPDAPYQPLLDVLGAIYHPSQASAQRLLNAIELLPDEIKVVAFEAVMQVLPSGLRQALEDQKMLIDPSWFTSDFARHHFARGKEAGFSEGRQEGLNAGRAEGLDAGRKEHLAALRALVADVLRRKLSPERAASLARLEQLHEPRKLSQLLLELTSASDEAQVIAAVERAFG